MEGLLQVRDLTIRYRSAGASAAAAVDHVSFEIASDESVGVIGESGCGKTSLALALVGLLPKEKAEISGSIQFRGQDLFGMKESSWQKIRGDSISMVYQEPGISLSPVMRVGTQIAEVARAHRNWKSEKCRAEAAAILVGIGLPASKRILSSYPHQLSGGQLARIVLAQALICRPALLIADEPTASLDAQSRASFIEALRELRRATGLSLLLISHTPEIQASLADRLLVMQDGRIVETGSFERLYRKPAHPLTKSLLRRKDGVQPQEETASERMREHPVD